MKRGQAEQGGGDIKIADLKSIKSLDQYYAYKFLVVLENTNQEAKQVLEGAAKTSLERLSIIWYSPLSHHCGIQSVRVTSTYIPDVDTNLADSRHSTA